MHGFRLETSATASRNVLTSDPALTTQQQLELDASRIAGSRLHISHIKTAGPENWHLTPALLDMVESYQQSGVTVTADLHPYIAGSTMATVFLLRWFLDDGNDAVIARLLSAPAIERARQQMLHDTAS